jgi:hypothetical protein
MQYRVLSVGIDPGLLKTRQAVLAACGYDSVIATPDDVDDKLHASPFDLIILSVMLSSEERLLIQSKLPAGTRVLQLEIMVWPEELLRLVAEALN